MKLWTVCCFLGLNGLNPVQPETYLMNSLYRAYLSAGSCLSNNGWSHPQLGTFSNFGVYCDKSDWVRSVNCCFPESPDKMDIKLWLSNAKGQFTRIAWYDLSARPLFTPGNFKILAHGWLEDITVSPWLNKTKDAWLRRDPGLNVIIVDWGKSNKLVYTQSVANVRTVGAVLAFFIVNMGIAQATEIIGMSLGAQITGEAGKWVHRNSPHMVKKCTGLDPAGPGFENVADEVRLDRTDCEVVTVIHSDAVGCVYQKYIGFGMNRKAGHCDFWVNCGHNQPNCPIIALSVVRELLSDTTERKLLSKGFTDTLFCSHNFATEYYYQRVAGITVDSAQTCLSCGQWPLTNCMVANTIGTVKTPPDEMCSPFDDLTYSITAK